MTTEIKIPTTKVIDLHTFFGSYGYTIKKRSQTTDEYRIMLNETLTDTQKAVIWKGLTVLQEQVEYDLGYAGETEAHAKARYKEAISQCTQARILTEGFEHPASSGKIFSLSALAQISWVGLFVSKDLMSYPYDVPTMDDTEIYSIADAAEVTAMWLAAMGAVSTTRGTGTAKKAEVEAAANAADARALCVTYFEANGCGHLVPSLGP